MPLRRQRVNIRRARRDAALVKRLPYLLVVLELVLLVSVIATLPEGTAGMAEGKSADVSLGTVDPSALAPYPTVLGLSTACPSDAAEGEKPRQVIYLTVTAYSSTPDQTDGNPFQTANGNHVRDGVVAANFLPFGARLRIPGRFGDTIFVVEDRMHDRYPFHIDVWMPDRESAQAFGIQYLKVEIL